MEQKTKKCPHCQSEIPEKAKKCPQCQSDLRNFLNRHPVLTVLGAFIIFIITINILVGGMKKEGYIQKVGEVPPQQEIKEEIYKIGDKVKRKDVVLTVLKVNKNWQSENPFDKPLNPEDVFVVVTVSLENQGSDELKLVSGFWDFKLEDANGVQRSEAIAAGLGLNKLSGQSLTSLSPGGKIIGDLIFSVPKQATSRLILHYQPLLDWGPPAKIELK